MSRGAVGGNAVGGVQVVVAMLPPGLPHVPKLPSPAQPHLHAHELGHPAVGRLDGRDGEQVPKGRAVLAVVEQAHGAGLALLDGVPDLLDLLGVRALALEEAAARGEGRGGGEQVMQDGQVRSHSQ